MSANGDEFSKELCSLFDNISKKVFNFDDMKHICKLGNDLLRKNIENLSDENKQWQDSFWLLNDIFEKASGYLVIANSEIDIRVKANYLEVFYILFMLTKDDQQAIRCVYNLDFKNNENESPLPQFHFYFKDYEKKLESTLTKISNAQQTPFVTRDLGFLLMISPRHTSNNFFSYYLKTKGSPNRFAQALREIPAFFELRTGISHDKRLVIISLMHHIASSDKSNQVSLNNMDDCRNLARILYILTKTEFNDNGAVIMKPVINSTELICDFLSVQISKDITPVDFSKTTFCLILLQEMIGSSKCCITWKHLSSNCNPAVDLNKMVLNLTNIALTSDLEFNLRWKSATLLELINRNIKAYIKTARTKPKKGSSFHNDLPKQENKENKPHHKERNGKSSLRNNSAQSRKNSYKQNIEIKNTTDGTVMQRKSGNSKRKTVRQRYGDRRKDFCCFPSLPPSNL